MFRAMTGCPVRMAVPVGPRPAFGVRPGDVGGVQVAGFEAGLGDRAHGLGFVLLGETDPGHAVATGFNHQAADGLKQLGLVGGAHQHLVAFA